MSLLVVIVVVMVCLTVVVVTAEIVMAIMEVQKAKYRPPVPRSAPPAGPPGTYEAPGQRPE